MSSSIIVVAGACGSAPDMLEQRLNRLTILPSPQGLSRKSGMAWHSTSVDLHRAHGRSWRVTSCLNRFVLGDRGRSDGMHIAIKRATMSDSDKRRSVLQSARRSFSEDDLFGSDFEAARASTFRNHLSGRSDRSGHERSNTQADHIMSASAPAGARECAPAEGGTC